MLIIGELINSTRKRIREAFETRDAAYIREVAVRQAEAGAAYLDVNGGIPGQEVECLCWLVEVVQDSVSLPVCLDSSDPLALGAALPLVKQRPMINSIPDERPRVEAVLPLVKEFQARVIALCMSESGPPSGVEDRVGTASRLIDRLTGEGIAINDIFVDTCAIPVSTGSEHGLPVAEAIGRGMLRYPGVHTSVGLSNASFGLPLRKLVNQNFIVLLMSRGLDAAIADPCDRQLMANVAAAEALLGRDEYCAKYLKAYRAGKLAGPELETAKQ